MCRNLAFFSWSKEPNFPQIQVVPCATERLYLHPITWQTRFPHFKWSPYGLLGPISGTCRAPRRMPKFPLLTIIILHSCAQFNWNFRANFRVYPFFWKKCMAPWEDGVVFHEEEMKRGQCPKFLSTPFVLRSALVMSSAQRSSFIWLVVWNIFHFSIYWE